MAREITEGMRTPKRFVPPMIPDTGSPALNTFMREFVRNISEQFEAIYDDLNLGKAKHEVYSSTPAAGDLDEGQIAIYDNASGTERLYTKANGSLRYVDLT